MFITIEPNFRLPVIMTWLLYTLKFEQRRVKYIRRKFRPNSIQLSRALLHVVKQRMPFVIALEAVIQITYFRY